jgi:hypothetical protein
MSRLHYDLVADRKTADIEVEDFTRLLTCQFQGNEDVRMDKPSDYINGFEYTGLALSGSLTSDTVWSIVRFTWINNRNIRAQYQSKMSWDNRSQGWPL